MGMEVGAARSPMNEGGAARSHREGTRLSSLWRARYLGPSDLVVRELSILDLMGEWRWWC